MSKQTAVEWLEQEFIKLESTIGVHSKMYELLEQVKEIEKQRAQEYAEFAIMCDRKKMFILNFEDWIRFYNVEFH